MALNGAALPWPYLLLRFETEKGAALCNFLNGLDLVGTGIQTGIP